MLLFTIIWLVIQSVITKQQQYAYAQEEEIINEFNENAIFEMYELNERPKTTVLLLYASECQYSYAAYNKLLQVQQNINNITNNNNEDSITREIKAKTKINFYKYDITTALNNNDNDNNNDNGSNNLINDYKELFQKINISTNVIPQIRIIITYRLPKSYKVNEVVYTYPKIISSNNNNDNDNDSVINDMQQFISFYNLRYSYSTSSPTNTIIHDTINYKFSPVVEFSQSHVLNEWFQHYKYNLFYNQLEYEKEQQKHIILFHYQTCRTDNDDVLYKDINFRNYHDISKYMSHYYYHVLFTQSLFSCNENDIDFETKLDVIYYDLSSSDTNIDLWDTSNTSKVTLTNITIENEKNMILFIQYHALPIMTNISSTTTSSHNPNSFTSLLSSILPSDYRYPFPSSTYYGNAVKVHTALFLSSSTSTSTSTNDNNNDVLIDELYNYSYKLRFKNNDNIESSTSSLSSYLSYFFIIPNNENNQRIIDYFNISTNSSSTANTLLITDSSNKDVNRVSSSLLRKFYWSVQDDVNNNHEKNDHVCKDASDDMIQFMDLFWEKKLNHSSYYTTTTTSAPSSSSEDDINNMEEMNIDEMLKTTSKVEKEGMIQIKSQESFNINIMNNPNKVLLYIYSSSYCSHVQATYPLIHDYYFNVTTTTEEALSSLKVMTLNIEKYPIYHPNMDILYLPVLYYFPYSSSSDGSSSSSSSHENKLFPISYGCDSITSIDDIHIWIRYVDELLEKEYNSNENNN